MENEEENNEENETTYTLNIIYSDDRDSDCVEGLSKENVKQIANSLKTQIESKKEYAVVEIDKPNYYFFRLVDMKNVCGIDVDEE